MQSDDDARRRNFGLVAEAMGLQSAIELLQARLDQITGQLDGSHKPAAEDLPVKERKPIGRPRGSFKQREVGPKKPGTGWPADPEERKREMARRRAKWKINATVKKIGAAQKASWAKLTPRQRKARAAKALAGRRAKKELPTASLAIAS